MGRDALQVVRDINSIRPTWNVLGFLADDPASVGRDVHEFKVLGDHTWLLERPDVKYVVAIGNPVVKRRIVHRLRDAQPATLISPHATVGHQVDLGAGAILCAGVHVTTDVRIGEHVILNLNTTVAHDATVGTYCSLGPGCRLSGNVHIREGVDCGTGVTAIPGVHVGEWSIVGAGAVVAGDLPPNCTAVGVPARAIKQRLPDWHLE